MSKKRVHEIAKELNKHGIELDNKDVVTELVALGYDVKSHSSSLEDDQATAAIQKIADKRKPKAPVAPVAAKGFVVRRKTPGAVAEPVEAPRAPEVVEPPPEPPEPAPAPTPAELAPPGPVEPSVQVQAGAAEGTAQE